MRCSNCSRWASAVASSKSEGAPRLRMRNARGLPEAPITDMTLTNVSIAAKNKMKIYFAKGIKFVDSKIETDRKGSPLETHEAEVTGIE